MNWIFLSIAAASLWAMVNHIDKLLIEKYCKNSTVGSLVLFSGLIGIPTALVIFFFEKSVIFINPLFALFTLIGGIIYILGVIPYLYALEKDETSEAAPMLLMTPVFSGILALIFLKEVPTATQVVASLVVVFGALWLSTDLNSYTKIKFRIFLLMAISSALMAGNALIFKYFALDGSFWAIAFWTYLGFATAGILILLIVKSYRKQFILMIRENSAGILGLNILNEIITLAGNLAFYFATLFAPLAIVEATTEGLQPVSVLLFGIALTVLAPKIAKEEIDKKKLLQKASAIMMMALGVFVLTTS